MMWVLAFFAFAVGGSAGFFIAGFLFAEGDYILDRPRQRKVIIYAYLWLLIGILLSVASHFVASAAP